MNRIQIFAFRVNNEERRSIADLAARLQRSQSDAVRFVVIEAARHLNEIDLVAITAQQMENSKSQQGESHVAG